MMKLPRIWPRRILKDRTAVSATEFAIVMPVFMILGMYGTEVAWMTIANMQVSQVAVSLADNASRLGQNDNSGVTPTIAGIDVQGILSGALLEGETLDLKDNGRVIVSSVETKPSNGKQYIHWQECSGKLNKSSKKGQPDLVGAVLGTLSGVTVGKAVVTAPANSAVMVAEVWYEHKGLFGTMFIKPTLMYEEAAVVVRDDRNTGPGLTGGKASTGC